MLKIIYTLKNPHKLGKTHGDFSYLNPNLVSQDTKDDFRD